MSETSKYDGSVMDQVMDRKIINSRRENANSC